MGTDQATLLRSLADAVWDAAKQHEGDPDMAVYLRSVKNLAQSLHDRAALYERWAAEDAAR